MQKSSINAGLIGYGYWGVNVAKSICESTCFNLSCIYDLDVNILEHAKKSHKDIKVFNSLKDILSSNIEAVFIATPPNSHFEIAKNALLQDKHVFVEKPFTTNIKDAYILFDLAYKRRKIALSDHLFTFAKPVLYIKQNLNKFGDIVYINARRINLGLFQRSTDVIWDLAVHDLSIVEFLFGLEIKKASVYKKKYKNFPNEAIANIGLELTNDIVVNIHVSWLSPIKIREMIIGGTQMTALYDDTKHDKLRLYEAGVVLNKEFEKEQLYRQVVQYNHGKIYTPNLTYTKPLSSAIEHFYKCIYNNNQQKEHKSIINIIKALEIISKTS